MIKICEYCGKEYKTSQKYRKTCSRECRGKLDSIKYKKGIYASRGNYKKIEVGCSFPLCLKTKMVKLSRYNNNKNKRFFCSKEHFGLYKSMFLRGEKSGGYKGGKVEIKCSMCGKPLMFHPCRIKKQKYFVCSKECWGEILRRTVAKKGENHPGWVEKVETYCDYCGEPISILPSQYNKSKYHFCKYKGIGKMMNKCFREFIKINPKLGEDNPNYHNGKSSEPYSMEFNNVLRRNIRRRDNFTCQKCGMTQEENIIKFRESLSIHHIDYDKYNLNENNLISLCKYCHSKTVYKRQYWINYFKDMVNYKYQKETELKQLVLNY